MFVGCSGDAPSANWPGDVQAFAAFATYEYVCRHLLRAGRHRLSRPAVAEPTLPHSKFPTDHDPPIRAAARRTPRQAGTRLGRGRMGGTRGPASRFGTS